MNNKLAILGAGGHGKVVADAALLSKMWSTIEFFDDAYPEKLRAGHWNVVGQGIDLLSNFSDYDGVVVAIGDNQLRLAKSQELLAMGAKLSSIIHPGAIISPFASIDAGSVIFAGAMVNVDAELGLACIINTGAVIEHDCRLADGVHISPNAALAGQTTVGRCSWVGLGAVTKQLVTIGSNSVVGAGAVVVESISSNITVVGNPAKLLK